MTLLYILIILVMLLFKTQAKQLLDSLIKLLVAIADSIVRGIK